MPQENSPATLTRRTPFPAEGSSAQASSAQQPIRSPIGRFPTTDVPPSPGIRRRSSTLTDFSPDDILMPKVSLNNGNSHGIEASHWHSAPLAFALFPAIGGLFFKNGSSVVTDVMLLGLAAIFLNWSVRLPWEWYLSAQTIREQDEWNHEVAVESETDDENLPESSYPTSLEDIAEEDPSPSAKPTKRKRLPAHEAASNELYTHELIALLSCFLAPLVGTYLLHTIRSQLTRPSEGLVSNYNLTIFLLAAELRPLSHLIKLVQSRTLHLQRIVNTNPYKNDSTASTLADLTARLLQLESKSSELPATNGNAPKSVMSPKQANAMISSVRQSIQPDLDALNRAVRRYEKRATLQTLQTDSRLSDLESRLNDAISLAAAAANGNAHSPGFTGKLVEWVGVGLMLPLQGLVSLAALPFQTLTSLISYGRSMVGRKESVDPRVKKSATLKNPGFRGSARSLKKV